MPAAEVDAMLQADQGEPHYNPDSRPIIKLLEGLRDRPARGELIIDKPGFRLELRKNSAPATAE